MPAVLPRAKRGVERLSVSDIHRAIIGRKVVGFSYYGTFRIVEPYCLGVSRAGRIVLRAYQISGGGSETDSGWRLFDVGKATGFRSTGKKFKETRPEFNPVDSQMREIYCTVA